MGHDGGGQGGCEGCFVLLDGFRGGVCEVEATAEVLAGLVDGVVDGEIGADISRECVDDGEDVGGCVGGVEAAVEVLAIVESEKLLAFVEEATEEGEASMLGLREERAVVEEGEVVDNGGDARGEVKDVGGGEVEVDEGGVDGGGANEVVVGVG